MSIRPVGDVGILVEVETAQTVGALTAWVNAHRLRDELVDIIPAATTVFLRGGRAALQSLCADLTESSLQASVCRVNAGRRHVVDVRYDGPDLGEVAERVGMSRREVIELHADTDYLVDFFGFAPGQAFFGGLAQRLQLPRRSTPRTRVPAGALAIANGYTVIYPQNSPGGWNLIGTRVSEPLWDIRRTPPNRLNIGDTVRFRPCQ